MAGILLLIILNFTGVNHMLMTNDLHCYACIDASFQCDDIDRCVCENKNLN